MHRFGAQLLAQLVDALPVGVFILDATGAAVHANAEAQALLGRSPEEDDHVDNLGSRYAAYVAGTDEPYPTSRMPIARALAGERTRVEDMEVDRDGQRVLLEVTATPILDEEGAVVFAVAVFRDITAQRRLTEELERQVATRTRALEQALRAKSAFLMNVSHDLRTPLSHIIGFSELLAERTDDERNRRLATTAQLSGLQLLGKIDDLIDLARMETESADQLIGGDFVVTADGRVDEDS